LHQRADAARLRAGEELADDPAGGEEERELVARVVDRGPVLGDVEARAPVGEVERSGALRHRVVAARLEEARRTGVVGRGLAGLRILRVAGPEDAHLALDLLVRDARVVGDAALAGDPQLLEDRARALEREAVRAA